MDHHGIQQLHCLVAVQASQDLDRPEDGRGPEHLHAGNAPEDALSTGGEREVPAKEVDTVAEQGDADKQHLSYLSDMGEAVVGEAWERAFLRTHADADKGHYVGGDRGAEIVDEVEGGHAVGDVAGFGEDFRRGLINVEVDRGQDIGRLVEPAEVGCDGAKDYRNGCQLDRCDG